MNITVNVSARRFADARLVNQVQAGLPETAVDPSRLQFERAERIAASDPKLTLTVLSHPKHMGMVSFATISAPEQRHCAA